MLTLKNLVDEYYLSNDFNSLVDKTKIDYQYCAKVLLETKVDGKSLAEIRLTKMTGAIARRGYEQWLSRGIYQANAITSVARKVY